MNSLRIRKQFNLCMAAQENEEQTKLEELKHLREKIKQFELELTDMKQIDLYRIAGAIPLEQCLLITLHQQKLINGNELLLVLI
uniref:Uncharacterized protein n=1 Tax=Globodera pallida TaxID=36090 RepID=A0A183C007_GLOPA